MGDLDNDYVRVELDQVEAENAAAMDLPDLAGEAQREVRGLRQSIYGREGLSAELRSLGVDDGSLYAGLREQDLSDLEAALNVPVPTLADFGLSVVTEKELLDRDSEEANMSSWPNELGPLSEIPSNTVVLSDDSNIFSLLSSTRVADDSVEQITAYNEALEEYNENLLQKILLLNSLDPVVEELELEANKKIVSAKADKAVEKLEGERSLEIGFLRGVISLIPGVNMDVVRGLSPQEKRILFSSLRQTIRLQKDSFDRALRSADSLVDVTNVFLRYFGEAFQISSNRVEINPRVRRKGKILIRIKTLLKSSLRMVDRVSLLRESLLFLSPEAVNLRVEKRRIDRQVNRLGTRSLRGYSNLRDIAEFEARIELLGNQIEASTREMFMVAEALNVDLGLSSEDYNYRDQLTVSRLLRTRIYEARSNWNALARREGETIDLIDDNFLELSFVDFMTIMRRLQFLFEDSSTTYLEGEDGFDSVSPVLDLVEITEDPEEDEQASLFSEEALGEDEQDPITGVLGESLAHSLSVDKLQNVSTSVEDSDENNPDLFAGELGDPEYLEEERLRLQDVEREKNEYWAEHCYSSGDSESILAAQVEYSNAYLDYSAMLDQSDVDSERFEEATDTWREARGEFVPQVSDLVLMEYHELLNCYVDSQRDFLEASERQLEEEELFNA